MSRFGAGRQESGTSTANGTDVRTRLQTAAHRIPILKTLVGFLVLNVAATAALLAIPAGAAEQAVVKVGETTSYQGTFGPIPLQNPVIPTAVQDPTPDECAVPVSWCDVIPIEVELPADYDPELTYLFTTVSLTWAQPPDTNDLDMYFWVLNEDGEYEESGGSATGAKPEQGSTEAHKFFVVINNFSGVNDGYELSASVTVERLGEKPFELLEPPARPLDLSAGTAPVTPSAAPPSSSFEPADSPSIAPSIAAPVGSSAPAAPNFAGTDAAPVLAQIDFAPKVKDKNSLVGEGAFGDMTPAAPTQTFVPAAASKPVPAGVLLLWLGVLPLVVLALVAVWLLRRGGARLAITA